MATSFQKNQRMMVMALVSRCSNHLKHRHGRSERKASTSGYCQNSRRIKTLHWNMLIGLRRVAQMLIALIRISYFQRIKNEDKRKGPRSTRRRYRRQLILISQKTMSRKMSQNKFIGFRDHSRRLVSLEQIAKQDDRA